MKSLRTMRSVTVLAATARRRRGAIVVLAAVMLMAIMAFTAFTVDVGYITLTKAQLQKSADGAALGGLLELRDYLGLARPLTATEVQASDTAARKAAVEVAAANHGGGLDSVYADGDRDVRLGQATYDKATGTFVKSWGTSPYNMIEVTLRRDQGQNSDGTTNTGGDRPLALFFAPVIGHKEAGTTAQSIAAMLPGVGFRLPPNQKVSVLPIALDEQTWNDLLAGVGPDDYAYDPDTGAISPGADGSVEANLYPVGSTDLPPGNRGTVDIGDPNNSTSDLSRQILDGLNEEDLSWFGGEVRIDAGPIDLNGDTGISAGIKDELAAIKGRPVSIPIFSQVSGPGNNATFTIVKFVGVRILDVKLTGGDKYVMVQPAPFSDPAVIPGDNLAVQPDSIYTQPMLIR